MSNERLTQLESHFAFGENWAAFSATIDQGRIDQAAADLTRLLPTGELAGKSFLDIGSGSGLSSLAAIRAGASSVTALDIDPNSVATTQATLTRFAGDAQWTARQESVFELSPERTGTFDVVYSWGVLHHTGDMWRAIRAAASLVKPGGRFVLAIYVKSPVCPAWKVEKRLYTAMPRWLQPVIRWPFTLAYLAGIAVTGRNPLDYVRDYRSNRGMSFHHDIHDWLGGYPYESASAEEIVSFLAPQGFSLVRSFAKPAPAAGLLGCPCNEFVLERIS
jgi:2-polyprenyl-6-hydroxyphenyl methylase/3-demethylubiquinone-9 3-methyltransferase